MSINLDEMPSLRKLLIYYVLIMYEEDAVITDDSLLRELELIMRENRLYEIFQSEALLTAGTYPPVCP